MMRVAILLLTVFLTTAANANDFVALVEKTLPGTCVVNAVTETTVIDSKRNYIEEYKNLPKKQKFSQEEKGASGTCFVVKYNNKNYIITNHHVIDNTGKLYIRFYKEIKRYPAKIVASDKRVDIAVLELLDQEKLANLKSLNWGSSENLKKGEAVWAIGHPLGFEYTVTTGVVSNESRRSYGAFQELIQTDVAINQGNSGGPLLDMDGKVVGVNTMIISNTGGAVGGQIGINFSVSSRVANYTSKELIKSGKVSRARIGMIYFADQDTGMVKIAEVPENMPAKTAGIGKDDFLLELNNQKILVMEDVSFAMDFVKGGDNVKIIVKRGDSILLKNIVTIEAPAD